MSDKPKVMPILFNYQWTEERRALQRAGVSLVPIGVPWAMIAPHNKQAERNHSQTLARLAERGGLGFSEAVAILEDRAFRSMLLEHAVQQLATLITTWMSTTPDPTP